MQTKLPAWKWLVDSGLGDDRIPIPVLSMAWGASDSLQGLEKGVTRHLCLGDVSEHGEDGRWSSKHPSQE